MIQSSYSIRPAREQDIPALRDVELAAAELLRGYAPDHVLWQTVPVDDLLVAQQQGLLLVALKNDDPIGFALLQPLSRRILNLSEVDVHPDHGRQGIGTALVRAVLGLAAMLGYAEVTLTTYRQVPWNMPFYLRLGFEDVLASNVPQELASVMAVEAANGLDPAQRVGLRYELAQQ